jgi:DNA-binding MarR family transcriptional regulator
MNERERDQDISLLFNYFNEINIIAQLSGGIFKKKLPDGLSSAQFSVLNWFIRVDNEATPGRLSTAFQVTKGAMTNTLKKLEEKQLITVEPDETSGRRKIVKITGEGRRVRQEALNNIYPVLEEFADAIGVDEIKAQIRKIQKVRKYVDDYRYR